MHLGVLVHKGRISLCPLDLRICVDIVLLVSARANEGNVAVPFLVKRLHALVTGKAEIRSHI